MEEAQIKKRGIIPLDWSRSKINLLVNKKKYSYKSMEAALNALEATNPNFYFEFVAEACYGSFSPEERARDLGLLEAHGHILKVYHSRLTHKYRKLILEDPYKNLGAVKYGSDPELYDLPDLLAIEMIAHNSKIPKRLITSRDIKVIQKVDPYSYYIRQRQLEFPDLAEAVKILPPAPKLDYEYQPFFCEETGYRAKYAASIAMVLYAAMKDSRSVNCRGFQKVIGFYGNAPGNVFRATLIRRNIIRNGQRKGELRGDWSTYQRGLRFLYHYMSRQLSEPDDSLVSENDKVVSQVQTE